MSNFFYLSRLNSNPFFKVKRTSDTVEFDSLFTHEDGWIVNWDVQADGGFWMVTDDKLSYYKDGIKTEFVNNDSVFDGSDFIIVRTGKNGHLWLGTEKHIYQFDGKVWEKIFKPIQIDGIANFILNSEGQLVVFSTGYFYSDIAYIQETDLDWQYVYFPFMPLPEPKAIGYYLDQNLERAYVAVDNGYFKVEIEKSKASIYFYDTNSTWYSLDDISCFTVSDPNYAPVYGTHEGVMGLYGFDNELLPNDTVNFIHHDQGTYYIGTDSGLLLYNGVMYHTLTTENTPLPSNKITFIRTKYGKLFIGTDQGLAIYEKSYWKVFDTSNVDVYPFYVTGAESDYYGNKDYFITTLGSGMIHIDHTGKRTYFNTKNNKLLDDSLYYVRRMVLGECGTSIAIGTKNHGLAVVSNDTFSYITSTYYRDNFKTSRYLVSHNYNNNNSFLLSAGKGLSLIYPCPGVGSLKKPQELRWYMQDDFLYVLLPEDWSGNAYLSMTDLAGRQMVRKKINASTQRVQVNVNNFSSGIYIVNVVTDGKNGYAKVIF